MIKMFKRKHSLKTASTVEEKRSKRWKAISFKNLQKLAAATGLCCYKPKNSTAVVRPHPVVKREETDSPTESLDGLPDIEENVEKTCTMSSRGSNTSLCSLDNVEKSIECPLNDAQLQRDISRVVERLNYLLNLSGNGNEPEEVFSALNGCSKDCNTVSPVPFDAIWDQNSSSLCIKMISQHGFKICNVPRCERLDSGLSSSPFSDLSPSFNGSPNMFHRRLSPRISADSGFFSTSPKL